MLSLDEAYARLATLPNLQLTRNAPLALHTRFALGGPAALLVESACESSYLDALRLAQSSGLPLFLLGAGTNLIAADNGFPGLVLRYTAAEIESSDLALRAQAGALLQDVVDHALARGFSGVDSLTGIPGTLGAAIYGNAGAYGRSLSDFVHSVRYFDGQTVRTASRQECEFRYRGSFFKQARLAGSPVLLLDAELHFEPGDAAALQARAAEILATRNAKFPPEMRCAGSIFKNLIVADLPPAARDALPASAIKGGKAPAAWFLDQVGARGLSHGGIRVTAHHANTLYHAENGTTADFLALVAELKARVRARFGLALEEEVQYLGLP